MRSPELTNLVEFPLTRDGDLVQSARSGSRQAASELIRRHQHRVTLTLRRILGASVDVADVSQDVFVEAFDKLSTLRQASAFPAWLRGIAIMRARALLRSRRRWSWLVTTGEPDEDAPAPAEASADVRAAASATYRELARLDPDDRIAFCLRHLEGMTLEEIADTCEVSLATVKRRVYRAEQHLQATLAAHEALARYVRSAP